MRGFTVYQPYANFIIIGQKRYETRPRKTNIRGVAFVHAGKRDMWKTGMVDLEEIARIEAMLSESQGLPPSIPAKLDYGAIVGTVEIVDCLPVEEIRGKISDIELALGDYTDGRFAWELKNPVRFEIPIPAKGQQGWWNFDISAASIITIAAAELEGKAGNRGGENENRADAKP